MVRPRYATKSCFALALTVAAFVGFIQLPSLLRTSYHFYMTHVRSRPDTTTALVGPPVFLSRPLQRTIIIPTIAYPPGESHPVKMKERGAARRSVAQRAKANKDGAILVEENVARRVGSKDSAKSVRKANNGKVAKKDVKQSAPRKLAWMPPYDPSKYRFISSPDLCPKSTPNGGIQFLVLAQSAVKNLDRRTLIRKTWGSVCKRSSATASASSSAALCRLGFVLGATKDQSLERRVREEADRYGDLVRSDFEDSYYNLSLSTVTALRWAHESCADYKYLLKADDDTFVNLAALGRYLATSARRHRRAIYGYLMKGFRPNRDRKSKWFTSPQLYNKARLPDFVSGFAYVVTRDAVEPLYAAARTTIMFPFEDVYVTGMCREKASGSEAIALENVAKFYNHKKRKRAPGPCPYAGVLAQHELTPTETARLWQNIQTGKCV